MKKRLTAFLLLAVLICLFTSCKGNVPDIHKQMAAGYGDEENTVIIDPFVEVTAKTTISGDDVSCEVFEENGEILGFDKACGLKVKCAEGCLAIEEIQFPGSKRMSVDDYMKGHSLEIGAILN